MKKIVSVKKVKIRKLLAVSEEGEICVTLKSQTTLPQVNLVMMMMMMMMIMEKIIEYLSH